MIRNRCINSLIDKLHEKKIAYACWFQPESEVPEIIIGKGNEVCILSSYSELRGKKGFLFAPFENSSETPLVLLAGSIYLRGYEQINNFDVDEFFPEELWEHPHQDRVVISREDYLKKIRETVNYLNNSELSKVIISRIIKQKRGKESLGKLLEQLHQQTPRAFVYLVSIPFVGTWLGATPEVLVSSSEQKFETVSLAGTQPSREDDDYLWHTKEIEEQAFVSRYMVDLFYRYGIYPYQTQGPETLASGPVAHLKTRFFFDRAKLDGKLAEFIGDLHPTPAVCGLPKQDAAEYIRQIEPHKRRYYAGFLGPWNLNEQVRLFVNLRCMEIFQNEYFLYSGGGITGRSVAEDEWEETRNKANTLLSAIQILQK